MKNEWFLHLNTWMKWHDRSPINRAAYCEARRCRGVTRRVERDAPRLQVDNQKGKVRVKGKGRKTQWVCQHCAINVPRKPVPDKQIGLWNIEGEER